MDKEKISKKTMEFLVDKKAKQVLDKPSAGCIFKNPPGDSAGRLIDISGLKDTRVGDALVSTRHANFIINAGKARCSDVLKLMDIIQKKVKKDHGILLEPEIKILG
jgi:UDP-N-acetylmuramate dehydrogenase